MSAVPHTCMFIKPVVAGYAGAGNKLHFGGSVSHLYTPLSLKDGWDSWVGALIPCEGLTTATLVVSLTSNYGVDRS